MREKQEVFALYARKPLHFMREPTYKFLVYVSIRGYHLRPVSRALVVNTVDKRVDR
jgi:hypothetical protein